MATCYVRVWIPNDPEEDWGYYDLFIDGTVTIKDTPLTDAVFAYGSDSKLYMYPESRTVNNYPVSSWAGYTAYRWKFTCDDTSTFEKEMSDAISSFDDSSNVNLVKCHLVSTNPFASYSRKEINSFAAVAVWANWLGKSNLLTDYNTAHNTAYQEYLPVTLANSSVATNWVDATMNGD